MDQEINSRPKEDDDEEFTSDFWRQQAAIFGGVDDLGQLAPADSPAAGGYGSGLSDALAGKGGDGGGKKNYSPFILSGSHQLRDFGKEGADTGGYVDPDHRVEELPSEMISELMGSGKKGGKYGRGDRKRRPRRKDIVVNVVDEEPENIGGDEEEVGRKRKGRRDREERGLSPGGDGR